MKLFLSFALSLVVLTGLCETYTFTGNGNWSVAGNWSNSTVPPQELPSGSTIYISPSPGDSCVLNVTQSILPGASLIVTPGAKFIIPGILGINFYPPAVTTTAISDLYSCSASSGGNVTSNGGSDVTAKGVVWSTSSFPTIALSTKTNDGTGIGSYSSMLYNLQPGVQYYVRAYATNAAGTSYGNEVVFVSAYPLINIITNPVIDIQSTTGVSGGFAFTNNDPCIFIFSRGVAWNTNPVIDPNGPSKTFDGQGPGPFQSFLTGLSPNTTYYVAAYIATNFGTILATPVSFTTLTTTTLTTSITKATSFTAATSGGNITGDGGIPITARGVVWSTSPGPTTALATKTNDGTGTGSYVSSITGLSPNTTYYVRAYAVNSQGTAYGNEVSFSTNDINGFAGVTICDQVWMKRNLDVSTYRNGDVIPQVTDYNEWMNLKTGAWCWYNNDSATYGPTYGRLYNWYALNDLRGLAPLGWHVASDSEWSVLSACLGGSLVAGGKMKETGTTHWLTPNSSATNSSGFTGLPGGYRTDDGQVNFVNVKEDGYWWTSTSFDDYQSTTWTLYYADGELTRKAEQKYRGFSVRCVAGDFPTVTTTAASVITETTATSGGNVINGGSTPVTARGIVWSTAENPTIALPTKTVDGSGTGSFISNLVGLTPNTAFHIRAWATNSVGTAYGADVVFVTPQAIPPDTLICSQRWATRNLTVSKYRNGDPIPQVTDRSQWAALTTGAWCWYNNDSVTYGAIYGKLYNWFAVNDPRGLAPPGWHIPTNDEWTALSTCLGGADVAGGKMKETGTSHWLNPNNGATNSSGFTGLPGGITDYNDGAFGELGGNGHWWSATVYDINYAYLTVLRTGLTSAGLTTTPKSRGLSVRCIKD